MKTVLHTLLISTLLLSGSAMSAQAGVNNYTNVTNYNYARDNRIYNGFSTDLITSEVESFTLNFDGVVQGWGNPKGRIYYSTGDSGWQYLGVQAEHYWTTASKSIFSTSTSDFDATPIHFGYVVGGGGGHKLLIRNASLFITTADPEPATLALLGLGFAGLVLSRRRAKKVATKT